MKFTRPQAECIADILRYRAWMGEAELTDLGQLKKTQVTRSAPGGEHYVLLTFMEHGATVYLMVDDRGRIQEGGSVTSALKRRARRAGQLQKKAEQTPT